MFVWIWNISKLLTREHFTRMDWLETTSLSELHTRARPAMFSKVSIGCLALILLAPAAVWPEAVGKTSRKNGAAVREQYLSKSYGEMQFSKYKGQLPTKGSIIECSIECFALTTCHCLGVNVNTNECSFFEAQRTLNMSKAQLAEYMFFTRDNFGSSGSDGFEKVNLAEKGKMTTSHGNTKHKGKGKQQQQPEAESNKNITRPWVQFEFKDPMYITEVQLTTLPGTQLRRFEIRVGNTKFSNEQTSQNSSEPSAEGNALCFEYNERKHFFAPSSTRRDAHVRSIKCQPCGLAGRYLSIQSFEPCEACLKPSEPKPKDTKKVTTTFASGLYPLPVSSVLVFGYPLK